MPKITIRKQLKQFTPGDWLKVYWPDPSADPVEDGSARELIDGHTDPEYGTLGHFLGIKTISGRQTLLMANDERVDNTDEEFRGTLTVPIKLIYRIEAR